MTSDDTPRQVEVEVHKVLGDRAAEWMNRPSMLLDGMAPAELARSQEGVRVVLLELDRAETSVRAAVEKRRRA